MWASTFAQHGIDCMSLHFEARHLLFLLIMLRIVRLDDMLSLIWYWSDSCNTYVWKDRRRIILMIYSHLSRVLTRHTLLSLFLEGLSDRFINVSPLRLDHAVKEHVLEAISVIVWLGALLVLSDQVIKQRVIFLIVLHSVLILGLFASL